MNALLRPRCLTLLLVLLALSGGATAAEVSGRWPAERSQEWLARHGWLRGCNFIPSTAINQLEMWQAQTWDETTIDRELGYAEGLGFNSVRVFLHDLPWQADRDGFVTRVDRFLALASRHRIGVLFVLFDSCWHPVPKLGPQPVPIPFTHNSGWVQSPGAAALSNETEYPRLHEYITGIVKHFAADPRIDGWDLWNEPENGDGGASARPGLDPKNKVALVEKLLPQVFTWAREGSPSQPLTSGVWKGDWSAEGKLSPIERTQLESSDVISFHNYDDVATLRKAAESLRWLGRPILCTEYMARPNGSTFEPHLGAMKELGVAAYCWGFVSGKTQTIFPWDSWHKKYTGEPPVWFHDILHPDGTPYRPPEVDYIRRVTASAANARPETKNAAVPASTAAPITEAGTYRNPVLRGDYPDPSVIRRGEDYYATATTSEWGPQFPILHSKDLINWQRIGTVFSKTPEWADRNFWAPEIEQWKGKLFLYYVGHKKGGSLAVAVATADQPEGPWTDHGPIVSQDAGSIDPMAVDDEYGERWLVWKEDGNSRKLPTPIWAQRLDETGTKLIGERHELIRNTEPWEGALVEGPFVMRRGDWFYLFFAGNACCGRGCNYGTGVARSKSLLGPWEKNPANPILTTNAEFRGPGHGSVVEDPTGRTWLIYHSYKLPSFVYTGREMMLDEITFGADGWPVIGAGKGPSSSAKAPAGAGPQAATERFFADDFTAPELRPGWEWPVRLPAKYRLDATAGGRLILTAPEAAEPQAVLARSCTSADYEATALVDAAALSGNAIASLSAFGDSANAVGIGVSSGEVTLWRVERGRREIVSRSGLGKSDRVYLRMNVRDGHYLEFSLSADGLSWTPVGTSADGDFLPPWDRSIRIAIMAEKGEAQFRSFSLKPL